MLRPLRLLNKRKKERKLFATVVVVTGGKFTAGVVDTGGAP